MSDGMKRHYITFVPRSQVQVPYFLTFPLDHLRYQWFWQRIEQLGFSDMLAQEYTSCSTSDAAPQLLMPTGLGTMSPLFKIVQDAALIAKELPSDQTDKGWNVVNPIWTPVGMPTKNPVDDATTPIPPTLKKATNNDNNFGGW